MLDRISELAESLAAHPDPEVAARVTELLDWVDAFHREGLGRLIEMTRAWRGELFLETAAHDEIVGTLLAAYGLGEDTVTKRAAAEAVDVALAEVRPIVESHGGSIEVDGITDGVVRIRMLGTCDGCPSSAATLSYGVEDALRRHWAGFRRLELVDPPTEIDPRKSDLTCGVPTPESVAAPAPLLQIRGHEQR